MFNDLNVIAIVPARGGSKGVPQKNIKLLAGKPLLVHTCLTAMRVPEIDYLLVSTDDDEIAGVARNCGANVIVRPAHLANDTAATEPVLMHAIEQVEQELGICFDVVLVLEPTSPLRSKETITKAIEMVASGFTSVLAVKQTTDNIGFIKDGVFSPINTNAPRRRQMRAPYYIESSTIYAATVDYLRETGTLVCDRWGAVVVADHEAVDINTENGFEYVEFLIQRRSDK